MLRLIFKVKIFPIFFIQAIFIGLLLGAGFAFPMLWWLNIIGLVCLLQFIVNKNTKLAILGSFVAWTTKAAVSLIWFWSAFPLDNTVIISAVAQISVISFYWLTSALWLGSGGVAFAISVRYLYFSKITPKAVLFFALPFLWLTGEFLSAITFSLLTIGPGSFIQNYFSFGQIGYLLGVTSFGIYAAKFSGVVGLTVIMASVGSYMWYLYFKNKISIIGWSIAGFFALIIISPYIFKDDYQAKNITVASINTEFSSELLSQANGYQKKSLVLETAINKSLSQSFDYILLPEDSRYFSEKYGDVTPVALANAFEFVQGSTSAVIIDSGRVDLPTGQTVLRAQVYDGKVKAVYQFDKQYLVPQGEYVPYLYASIMRLLGFKAAVDAISLDSSYSPGHLLEKNTLPVYIPGVLFCFESVRPTGAKSLINNRTIPFVAHPISHSWFHNPRILWQQLDVMLAIQARYSGVPIVSAGNMAIGKLYLPNGKIEFGNEIIVGDKYQVFEFKF